MSLESTPDRFELRIFFATNPLTKWETAQTFLDVLLRNAGPLTPTSFRPRYDKIVPLTIDVVSRFVDRQKSTPVLVFTGDQGVGIEWTGYPPKTLPASKLIMRIPFPLLSTPDSADRLLILTKALCTVCPPVYGWGHSEEDVRLANDPHATDAWAPQELVQVYWLTILGPEMVKGLNRSHVAATPAYRVEMLENGSAMIVTSPAPGELLSHAAREEQATALAHLCPDRPVAHTLRDLLDRSAKLQPVASHWDPNLAELFRMIVDAVPLSERRAKELEFNAYHPPEITEWRSASQVLPADVDDVGAAVDTYHRDGQTFVARYHDELPGLMDGEPEVLSRIDGYFYLRDSLRKDPAALQRLMVPTLGAYLGTMMERLLDGEWVPRQNLEESQVVVGDRAWLPFFRVKQFLQSKKAALDFSLTRYFYEASVNTVHRQ